ncbi:MAG: hypothetical protein AAF700_03740 [Pseudomonadota bacterium]
MIKLTNHQVLLSGQICQQSLSLCGAQQGPELLCKAAISRRPRSAFSFGFLEVDREAATRFQSFQTINFLDFLLRIAGPMYDFFLFSSKQKQAPIFRLRNGERGCKSGIACWCDTVQVTQFIDRNLTVFRASR